MNRLIVAFKLIREGVQGELQRAMIHASVPSSEETFDALEKRVAAQFQGDLAIVYAWSELGEPK